MKMALILILVLTPDLRTSLMVDSYHEFLANIHIVLPDPVKPVIGTVKQQFSGGLALNEDGRWGRNSTTTPQYVGLPSVTIDNAWLDLLTGKALSSFLLSEPQS
jgi:hypothetical protein